MTYIVDIFFFQKFILRQYSLPENPHYSIGNYQFVNDILPQLLQKEKETSEVDVLQRASYKLKTADIDNQWAVSYKQTVIHISPYATM